MEIEYRFEKHATGIIDLPKYKLEDTEENLKKWQKLKRDFSSRFIDFSSENLEDYELTDWHDEINCLYVYVYNEKFYNNEFIPAILKILNDNGECFAQFECYDDEKQFIGNFQIYPDKVIFDENSVNSGLSQKLSGN
ncbi:MAG: hypothetical protein CSB21_03960 [Deltaproteobacteria bacterium]|nr:MAG: hypothetical protein CSB21_03960 [Deltaproteobacteria bacterium]